MAKKRLPVVQWYKDKKKEWRWRLLSVTKRILADSGEGYKTRSGCKKAIERVTKMLSSPVIYEEFVE